MSIEDVDTMRPNFFTAALRRAFYVFAVLMLSNCGHSSTEGDSAGQNGSVAPSSDASSFSFPAGLVVDAKGYTVGQAIDGVYPGAPSPDPSCCWLGPKAAVVVDRSTSAKNLRFVMYVPDSPYLRTHPENVTITIAAKTYRFSGLGPGIHNLPVQLDQRFPNGRVRATIAGDPWIPAKTGGNADVRKLTVILNSVAVVN